MMRPDAFHARSTSAPLLCYVTDRCGLADSSGLTAQISRAAAARIDWIQIREKDLSTCELLALASTAVKIAAETPGGRTRIIINDRLDEALAARAAGVHLGESSLPVAVVSGWRARGGSLSEILIGASCHSLETALEAERDGADYIFFGPVFATPSKAKYGAPQGIKQLARVSSKLRIPVLAIGGITAKNAHECLAAGGAGIAAIRMFQDAGDLAALTANLRSSEKGPRGAGKDSSH
jgi:thiamine-phosphate pyrophosphorylase